MTAGVARSAPISARSLNYRRTEEDYIALRNRGKRPDHAASLLGLTASVQERLEMYFRAQSRDGQTDLSSPAFAHHDRHIAQIMARGGFLRFAWRKSKQNQPIYLDANGRPCTASGEPLGRNA